MSETPQKDKLDRDAFYALELRFIIGDELKNLPNKFSINQLITHLNSLLEKPFEVSEMKAFRKRCMEAMRTIKRKRGISISHERTSDNNLLTHYQQKTP
jgi:hypothetical protein